MEVLDLAGKATTAANGVLDVLKKEWFLNLALWLVLITELNAILTGRSMTSVLHAVLVKDFNWKIFEGLLAGVEHTFSVLSGYELVATVWLILLFLLGATTLVAFWQDGQRQPNQEIMNLASLNLTLRATTLVTIALTFNGRPLLMALLVAAVVCYALGAAAKGERQGRIGRFMLGALVLLFLGMVTFVSPVALGIRSTGRALLAPIR